GAAVPGRGLLPDPGATAVPGGLLAPADLHHAAAPAPVDDLGLSSRLLLRSHPHHRGCALRSHQPGLRRPREGRARGDAPGPRAAGAGALPGVGPGAAPRPAAAPPLPGRPGVRPVPAGPTP